MSNNIKIGYGNIIDDATITTNADLSADLPVSNLQNFSRNRVFRLNSGINLTITLTFTAQEIGCIAFWLVSNPDAYVSHITVKNGVTTVFETTSVSNNSLFFTPVTATSVVIIFRSDIVFDISRIFVGKYFEPVLNPEYGLSIKYRDLSESERTEDGSLHIRKKSKYRILTFNLVEICESDRQMLAYIVQQAGTQNDVFVSVFKNFGSQLEFDFELLGVFEDGAELATTSANRWQQKLTINEL